MLVINLSDCRIHTRIIFNSVFVSTTWKVCDILVGDKWSNLSRTVPHDYMTVECNSATFYRSWMCLLEMSDIHLKTSGFHAVHLKCVECVTKLITCRLAIEEQHDEELVMLRGYCQPRLALGNWHPISCEGRWCHGPTVCREGCDRTMWTTCIQCSRTPLLCGCISSVQGGRDHTIGQRQKQPMCNVI